MSTLEKVKKVVVDQLSCDEVMAFEEEFGCEIPDEEAEKIQTVQDAVNYIEAHS